VSWYSVTEVAPGVHLIVEPHVCAARIFSSCAAATVVVWASAAWQARSGSAALREAKDGEIAPLVGQLERARAA